MATLKNKELVLDDVVLKVLNFPAGSTQSDIYAGLQSLYAGFTVESDIPCFGFYHDRCFNKIKVGTYSGQPAIMCDFDSINVATFLNDSAVVTYGLKLFTIK